MQYHIDTNTKLLHTLNTTNLILERRVALVYGIPTIFCEMNIIITNDLVYYS